MARELPAVEHLGYSLNMLEVTPADINSLTVAVKRGRRILQFYPDEDTREVTIGKEVYNVPRCIGISSINSVNGAYTTYKSGSEANSYFEADASLSVRYLGVSGSVSASYATEKMFRQENQYAFYSFNSSTYVAVLRDWADLLNETALKRRLETMPRPFDANNESHVNEWKEFFDSWGTHVILNATYGARYQLEVHASNSESSVNNRFSSSVQASYNGIMAGGDFDASVKSEEQYKTFTDFKQQNIAVKGGDANLSNRLGAIPSDYDLFIEWAESVASFSDLCNFTIIDVWTLMREAVAKELRDLAGDAEKAYKHLSSHRNVYQTQVTLTIESDWAEFGLLTPSAVIVPAPNAEIPSRTVFTETRVQWGKEFSHQYERKDIRFMIINDGSPIDFYISHGSKAGQGQGKATVIIESAHYTNDKITDNFWNTEWYYQKPASGRKIPTKLSSSKAPQKWSNVLSGYLHEIGFYKHKDANVAAAEELLELEEAAE
ncbi:hypothetical protein CCMSSC00406_0009904 [Pleurotus cornucopiae]|uniref:Uncharacterized protein n=1 Tax=Pleurotus cornucopiae TaxID=5321 RepID=A0ACB7IKN6_PLECO|nr:hypothetical protein CCMSSC00406_0009904 [Pleurotus cornucopiae]